MTSVRMIQHFTRELDCEISRSNDQNALAKTRMAQHPVNRNSPRYHQREREWQRDQRDAATEPQRRVRVERQRECDPRETECLDQSQYQLAPVVHHEKIVKIEKIKSGEAEEARDCRFKITMPFDELVVRTVNADAQVHGGYDRTADESPLGKDQ